MSDNDALEIWQQYKQNADPRLRDRLILTYAPLVKYVAGRLGTGLPAHVEEGDLVSYGLLGLMDAIERYDPGRDIKFETYAISRIKGSIIDELRSLDWVPRSVRSRAREIERAIVELENKLPPAAHRRGDRQGAGHHRRRVPGQPHPDLALVGGGARRAVDDLDLGRGHRLADRHAAGSQRRRPVAGDDPHRGARGAGQRDRKLPEREKTVITLYYYEELTLREIGEVLGVTESRVSQLHTKAILRLKAKLQGSLERASLERNR